MNRKQDQFELDHWRAQEVLHTFAERERARGNAASAYPDVARHLKSCSICRDTLEDILTTTEINLPRRRISTNDLEFLRRLREWRGKSQAEKSSSRVFVPLRQGLEAEPSSRVQRGTQDDHSADRRPLFLDMIRIGSYECVLLLMLYPTDHRDQFRLTGEISEDESLLRQIKVKLSAGRQSYTATLTRNRFLFDNVVMLPTLEQISLTFDTPPRR